MKPTVIEKEGMKPNKIEVNINFNWKRGFKYWILIVPLSLFFSWIYSQLFRI